jgi:hypothetical protein
MFLSAEVTFNRVLPHSHWTGVHRIILKTKSDFSVAKNIPAICFAQPFPTVRAVGYGPLSTQRFYFATSY